MFGGGIGVVFLLHKAESCQIAEICVVREFEATGQKLCRDEAVDRHVFVEVCRRAFPDLLVSTLMPHPRFGVYD
jgi:hypothetical protein